MLARILALIVGLGGFSLYMVAFFFPEVHRKSDFYWSGLAMFYGLVLWVCAGRITGGVLLGQMAGVALLGWFGWQTLMLRRELTPAFERTEISAEVSDRAREFSVGKLFEQIGRFLNRRRVEETPTQQSSTEDSEPTAEAPTTETETSEETPPDSQESVTPPQPPSREDIEAARAEPEEKTPPLSEQEVETEVAPDAQLAPAAEPFGKGDPRDRQTLEGEEEIVAPESEPKPPG